MMTNQGGLHWPVSLPHHVVVGATLQDDLQCLVLFGSHVNRHATVAIASSFRQEDRRQSDTQRKEETKCVRVSPQI